MLKLQPPKAPAVAVEPPILPLFKKTAFKNRDTKALFDMAASSMEGR